MDIIFSANNNEEVMVFPVVPPGIGPEIPQENEDFNAVTGMNPMVEEQLIYFYDAGYDRLHPDTKGQERMARTLMYQLLALPVAF